MNRLKKGIKYSAMRNSPTCMHCTKRPEHIIIFEGVGESDDGTFKVKEIVVKDYAKELIRKQPFF